jgi:hypothetical protein
MAAESMLDQNRVVRFPGISKVGFDVVRFLAIAVKDVSAPRDFVPYRHVEVGV